MSEQRAELADLIDDNAVRSELGGGVANPGELADLILAAGFVKADPEVLAEAKAALESLPANAVEAHHKQVIGDLLNSSKIQ